MAKSLEFVPYVHSGESTSDSAKSSGVSVSGGSKGVKRDCGAAELDK